MGSGTLFVTAASADSKAITSILLYMREWDGYEHDIYDWFKLITTDTVPSDTSSTAPPVLKIDNQWAGGSFEEVEAFALAHSNPEENHELNFDNAVVVDERGLQDRTCIIMDRVKLWHDDDENQNIEYPNKMNKVRLPWEDVGSMFVNLDIANMGWEDFVEDEKGATKDGWWQYKPVRPSNPGLIEREQAVIEKRSASLKAFEEKGQA